MLISAEVKGIPKLPLLIVMTKYIRGFIILPVDHVSSHFSVYQTNNLETISTITSKIKAGLRSVSLAKSLSSLQFNTILHGCIGEGAQLTFQKSSQRSQTVIAKYAYTSEMQT